MLFLMVLIKKSITAAISELDGILKKRETQTSICSVSCALRSSVCVIYKTICSWLHNKHVIIIRHIPQPSESLLFWYLQKQSTEPGLFLHSNFALGQVERTAHSSISMAPTTTGGRLKLCKSMLVFVRRHQELSTCAVVSVSREARLTGAGVVLFGAVADGVFVAGEGERQVAHVCSGTNNNEMEFWVWGQPFSMLRS